MDQSRSIARKVCDFISCSSKSFASLRLDIKQIKEIRERLGGIEDDLSKFGFKDRVHHHQDINGNVPKEWEIITHSSSMVASDVFERGGNKENIIKALMQYGNVDGADVEFTGPAGIGKTTVAKLVYNDKRIDETFDIKMWVSCRQKYFELEKEIIIDMIYSVTGRIENTMEIGQLQHVLQDILMGKKYLLVLDEFELQRDLSKLKRLLSVGAKESKIIAIESLDYTRNYDRSAWDFFFGNEPLVAGNQLNWLSKESSLSLFMRYAFEEGNEKNPLREIGEEIATKYAGRPLLLKILGSILYFSTDEDDWKYVRDNIKQLGVKTEGTGKQTEKGSISVLKLGYDLLPSHLKQCFVCCSFFPFDHGFNNITLIHFWMAHGLLQSDDESEDPESIGIRYINELRCRCLFQDFEQNFDFITFKMHYLVHLLAREIAKNERLIMDSGKQYYRHISVVSFDEMIKTFSGSKMTRSILFFNMINPSQSLIGSCTILFPNLRVLDFRYSDTEVLPESIGNLKRLRYLNLTKNIKIRRLPKSLLLGGCKELEELPTDIGNLVNLRILVFSSKQRHLTENGIGCLTSLRRLGIGSCYNLEYLFEDIGRLKALRTLTIGDCPKLVSLPPGVKDLSSLENLMLSDCEKSSICNLKMEMELQCKKPHLRMLCIDGLPEFNEWPQWLLQCSANTLQWLAIKNCPKFERLPAESLHILESLEVLEIWNCPKFSSLPEDMHGLTAMREVKVRDCPDLSKRCRWGGEDRPKIDHIPKIELDGKRSTGEDRPKIDHIPEIELDGKRSTGEDRPKIELDGKLSTGEDRPKIDHIPEIELDGKRSTGEDRPKIELDGKLSTGEDRPKIDHIPKIELDGKLSTGQDWPS
ncbi:hypothetical protein LWI29_024729 [Acer saccharum]|uniref:NB-ARC domain-containing protein n=1 Tax=Acer saccharum TaxID=4024 RepID=A0AA39SNL2_ACESA|nr:hypothetical protein LWI29_024729 [Acer saccharum]